MMTGSRAGDKKKSVTSSKKSRTAAFNLLIWLMNMAKDSSILKKFVTESNSLHDLVTMHMPVPKEWGKK